MQMTSYDDQYWVLALTPQPPLPFLMGEGESRSDGGEGPNALIRLMVEETQAAKDKGHAILIGGLNDRVVA
jgi:hypothetical protein